VIETQHPLDLDAIETIMPGNPISAELPVTETFVESINKEIVLLENTI
jgi:hypothetical protein